MPVRTHLSVVLALGLSLAMQAVPGHAQSVDPVSTPPTPAFGSVARGPLGRPQAFGRLLVTLEVVPTCVIDSGTTQQSTSIHCTRGVSYRARILDDTDAAYGRTESFASRPAGEPRLVRIEAQRMNVEF